MFNFSVHPPNVSVTKNNWDNLTEKKYSQDEYVVLSKIL